MMICKSADPSACGMQYYCQALSQISNSQMVAVCRNRRARTYRRLKRPRSRERTALSACAGKPVTVWRQV